MKLNQLRKIIREEVKAAVKEELQEMLTEAVRVASQPATKPSVEKTSQPNSFSSDSLTEMLNQTKASMTNEDLKYIMAQYANPIMAKKEINNE